jgi:SAM-dependent methyltransferase
MEIPYNEVIGVLVAVIAKDYIMERTRKRYIRSIVEDVPMHSSVLDFGSETCMLNPYMQDSTIVNLDVSSGKYDRLSSACNVQLYDGDIIPFDDHSFDVAVASFVIHHIDNQMLSLKELRRVARKLILLEDLPSRNWSLSRLTAATHYVHFGQSMGMINKMHSVTDWSKMLQDCGWRPVSVTPINGSLIYPCSHVKIVCV